MKLIFPIDQYKKLRAYVGSIKYEISGLGKISVVGQTILVEDIRIFKQTVSGGDTSLDRRGLGKFYDEIIQKEGDLSKWKCWWHSHAEMDAFWSTKDVETIEDFDNEMAQDNWMLSLVTNHNAKMAIRVDIFKPLRCTIEEIDWDIDFESPALDIEVGDEVAEKVTIFAPREHKSKRKVINWNHQPRFYYNENGEIETDTNGNSARSIVTVGEEGFPLPLADVIRSLK